MPASFFILPRLISIFLIAPIFLLSAQATLSLEVPADVTSAYQRIPRLKDAKGGRCYIRAAVVHHQLRDILPADAIGNVFIFYGTDQKLADGTISEKAFHVSPDHRNWVYHVAPLYIDEQGRPWVLEVSPWVHQPLPLNEWLAFNVSNFEKAPCEKVDVWQESDRLEQQSIYCKVAITPPSVLNRNDIDDPMQPNSFRLLSETKQYYLKYLGKVIPNRKVRREVFQSFKSPEWVQYLGHISLLKQGRLQSFIDDFLKSDRFDFEPLQSKHH